MLNNDKTDDSGTHNAGTIETDILTYVKLFRCYRTQLLFHRLSQIVASS